MSSEWPIERSVELFAAINFLILGLSHLSRPREWIKFFIDLRGKGSTGAFVNGFLSLSMGSVIVAFHNVWTWPGVVLTVVGWLYVAKSLVAFAAPRIGARSMALVSEDNSGRARGAGIFLLILGGFLLYVAMVGPQYQGPGAVS